VAERKSTISYIASYCKLDARKDSFVKMLMQALRKTAPGAGNPDTPGPVAQLYAPPQQGVATHIGM
jgi:hypothetical protein